MTGITSFRGAYRFLSNFYPVQITDVDGLVFPSVEHAFQAAKTLDPKWRAKIRNASSAAIAKALGKQVPLVSDWEARRVHVMERLLRQKFLNPVLRQHLLNTGDAELIEGNTWHDNFWGFCHCDKCFDVESKNHLGKLLMQIRGELAR